MASFNYSYYFAAGQPENGLHYFNSEYKNAKHQNFTQLGSKSHPYLICDAYPTLHTHQHKRPDLFDRLSSHEYSRIQRKS